MEKREDAIQAVEEFVRRAMEGHDAGHRWSHVERVTRLSLYIHDCEKVGNRLVIEFGALLHDIGDHKFGMHDGPEEIKRLLGSLGVDNEVIDEVISINKNISFSKRAESKKKSNELRIVQDADRLDAMGAVGIARAFSYGGFKGREIYDPEVGYINPVNFNSALRSSTSTIHHFYEKLLILKDLMNTATGKRLAGERHDFMVRYLEQFYRELGSSDEVEVEVEVEHAYILNLKITPVQKRYLSNVKRACFLKGKYHL